MKIQLNEKKEMGRIVLFFLLLAGISGNAQVVDPVKWEFSANALGNGIHEVVATATMDAPWHIYSQYTEAGGPQATVMSVEPTEGAKAIGRPRELGKLEEKYEEVFEVITRYYGDTVSFVQKVEKQGNESLPIMGTVLFMACTDNQCLLPKEVEFKVVLDQ